MDPVRTCIGCRREDSRANLMRFVTVEGRIVADPEAVRPGRGAWLHASSACFDAAIARRAFGRALRVSTDIDPNQLREQAERLMDK